MVMATFEPHNSTPLIWYPGTKDESIRAVPYVAPEIPMHLPVVFTYASKGPFSAVIASASSAVELFGEEIFDEKSPYGTLATPFANLFKEYANPMMIQRLHPKDMPEASRFCLAIEYVRSKQFKKAEFNALNNEYAYDANNELILDKGEPVDGILARWVVLRMPANGHHGELQVTTGDLHVRDDVTTTSKVVPILEFKAQWKGKQGNNIGIRINVPTRYQGLTSQDLDLTLDQGARLYDIQVVTRPNDRADGSAVQTNYGSYSVRGMLKPGAFDMNAGNASVDLEEIFLDHYQDFDTRGGKPAKYGHIGSFHIYHDNLKQVLTDMYKVESLTGNSKLATANSIQEGQPMASLEEALYLMNPFTGRDQEGRPYNAIYVMRELDDQRATSISADNTFWLRDGGDGTMNDAAADELVREIFDTMSTGNEAMPTTWRDQGKYPFRQIYDVGYSTKTKVSMYKVLGVRQEANLTMSTCDFIANKNQAPDVGKEESIGANLVSKARNYPESELFGTGAMRACIIPQAMKLINNPRYKKYVPMTYEVARMRAQYMGQPGGMLPGYGYDAPPYNHVTEGKEVTNAYIPVESRIRSWDNGLSYFLHKTDRIMFCPGLKTVYKNDTSVLTSDITMQIICDIDYICFQVWTELTGNSKMSDEEFMKESDRLIADRVRNRYDGRVVVVPNTYKDTKDKAQGYSWTCRVDLYANNTRTLNKSFVVAKRMEDLQ